MVDSIKITALMDIGANIAYTTLVPVVNMSGTPTTQKANLQILGNLILNGAGGSYFPRAAQANLALSVANAAQPNITSVGTLTSLNVTGNVAVGNISSVNIVQANVYYGDGGALSNISGGSPGGSTSQIQFNSNGSFGGSSSLVWDSVEGRLISNIVSLSNVISTASGQIGITPGADANGAGPTWTFDSSGGLYWPAAGGALWVIEPNIDSEFEIKSTSNVVISTDTSNANAHFTFDSDGIFTAPSNVNLLGSRLNVGPDAISAGNLLNPTLVIANTGAQFIQAAIINNDGAGSADLISYGAGGSDLEAWTDMGYAGFSFNDANYTITSPGDGYLFVQGYANGVGGNMVLATGENSATKDIIFGTGGFTAADEFARISHANNALELTRTGAGIKFEDGTTQTTAALVWTTAPVANTSAGTAGQAAYDSGGNLYVCVATNTWSKFSGTTSW
jgi:hypothetical protein